MSEIFNAMAAKYDTPERIALAHLVTQTLDPYFKDNQHQTLIDIGGGTGLVSLPLAAYVQHLAIWDTAPNMIEVSEKKSTNCSWPMLLQLSTICCKNPCKQKQMLCCYPSSCCIFLTQPLCWKNYTPCCSREEPFI